MKKLFKLLTVAILAIAAAVACFAVAGCTGKDDEGAADYVFYIQKEDGTALNGQTGGANGGKVSTQICLPESAGGMCVKLNTLKDFRNIDNIFPDENGKISLSQSKVNELFLSDTDVTVFIFHVMNVPGYKADCEIEINGHNTYTIKLSK